MRPPSKRSFVAVEARSGASSAPPPPHAGVRACSMVDHFSMKNLNWGCACDGNFTFLTSGGGLSLQHGAPYQPSQLNQATQRLEMPLAWDDDLLRGRIHRWASPGPLQQFNGTLPHRVRGFDPVCRSPVVFQAEKRWFRDAYRSKRCQTIPRERALMFVLWAALPKWRKASAVHESSPNRRNTLGLSHQLRRQLGSRYTATQFHPSLPCGTPLNTSMNESVTNLESQCFADGSFDLVITQDVFEHIYDPVAAFSEIERTLRPGGMHLFTVPVTSKRQPTFKAASLGSLRGVATTILHAEPEIHLNPMGRGGSLVTHQWGYDILSFVHRHTGMPTYAVYLESRDLGVEHAEHREVFVSVKKGRHPLFDSFQRSMLAGQKCRHGFITCRAAMRAWFDYLAFNIKTNEELG